MMLRIGIGNDTHKLVAARPLILGGVTVPSDFGSEGHSDGDALTHAITDAILGALCEGDIGVHFPDNEQLWKDADSMELLARVVWLAKERGYEINNVDATVMLERPRLRDHIDAMREKLAQTMNADVAAISVKAKTGEGLGVVGRGDAVVAYAVVLLLASQSK